MGRYLLDSNAFLRFKIRPQALRPQARETIVDPGNQLFVSLASLWELAIKAASGRLEEYEILFARGVPGLSASLRESNFDLLPIELGEALAAASLPRHHGDPFDRLMIAQAIERNLTLISSDRTFRRYPGLRLVAA
jgi:PIN domain nuclease of toxin-antitoxin system